MHEVEPLLRDEYARIASVVAPRSLSADELIRGGAGIRRRRRLTLTAAAVVAVGATGLVVQGLIRPSSVGSATTPSGTVRLSGGLHGIQLAAQRTGALRTYVYSARMRRTCTTGGEVTYDAVDQQTVTIDHDDFHQVAHATRTDAPVPTFRRERFRVNGYLYSQGDDLRQAGPQTHRVDPRAWRRIASPATPDSVSWGRSAQEIVQALAGNDPLTPQSTHGSIATYHFTVDAAARSRLLAASQQILQLVTRAGNGDITISIDEDAGLVRQVESHITDPPMTADVIKDGKPAKSDPITCTRTLSATFTASSMTPAITLPAAAQHAITDPGRMVLIGGELS